MPNGKEILQELSFEATIKGMDDRHLLEFTARKTYEMCNRVITLEARHVRTARTSGALTGGIISLIIALITYFTKRG